MAEGHTRYKRSTPDEQQEREILRLNEAGLCVGDIAQQTGCKGYVVERTIARGHVTQKKAKFGERCPVCRATLLRSPCLACEIDGKRT